MEILVIDLQVLQFILMVLAAAAGMAAADLAIIMVVLILDILVVEEDQAMYILRPLLHLIQKDVF